VSSLRTCILLSSIFAGFLSEAQEFAFRNYDLENGLPTALFIECLENSELIVFDRKCLVEAKLSDEQRKDEIRLMSRRIAVLQRRVLLLMSSSAKERYNSFLATNPDLPNRVPQHMIASYLGITPQALSTIRREIVGKN
jgi:CRP-like cAMP-binding protein